MESFKGMPLGWQPETTLHCISKCESHLIWSNIANNYRCPDCNALYTWQGDSIKDRPGQCELLAHEKPIAYIAGALNDMSCAYLGNVRKMILWAEKIRALGYAVFIPGIDLLCGIACDGWSYDVCFDNSQPFLAKSDVVFVCPGWENSKGTKRELDTAKNLSIPIYCGDKGYQDLQVKFIASLGTKMADNMAKKLRSEISDEESVRDRRRPYMRADEGTCNKHVESDAKSAEQIAKEIFAVNNDAAVISRKFNKPRFIEDSNYLAISDFLATNPRPDYKLASVIKAAQMFVYTWELKDA